jgi:hypothetical protein
MPGNRPATKLLPEKASDDTAVVPSVIDTPSRAIDACEVAAGTEALEVVSSDFAVLAEVDWCEDAAMVDVGSVEVTVDTETAHTPSWQVAPTGQHESPHLSRGVVGSEWNWFPGNMVAFCACSSQLIGEMNLQSSPAGQHRTAVADESSWRQVVDDGQQKSEGNDAPHWNSVLSPPQTEPSFSSRRCKPDKMKLRLMASSRRDERASSSVAIIDPEGTRITAADTLEIKKQTIVQKTKVAVAMPRKRNWRRKEKDEDTRKRYGNGHRVLNREEKRLRLTLQAARHR